jgi:leucyl aminopeptidase (aminopeptidase T)
MSEAGSHKAYLEQESRLTAKNMSDTDSVARTAIEVSLDVRSGENVLIHGWEHTLDLMSRMAWHCRRRGCNVMLSIQPEDLWFKTIMASPLSLLENPSDQLIAALKKSQAYVFTLGPRRPIPWKKIPEKRRGEVSVWLDRRYDHSRFAAKWAAVAKKYEVRMLAIEATLATPERARALGLNFKEWREVMLAGCSVDWKSVSRRSKGLIKLLSGQETVHLTTPAGTRLSFRLDRRRVEYSDGLTSEEKTNKGFVTFLPSGGIEVSIDEESAEGRIIYDLPIRLPGRTVRNLKLDIQDGQVREFSAEEGKDAFEEYLSNGGDAARLGFFSLGLNPNLRFGFTQDDKVLGGATLGLGDNKEKGGKNRANGNGWWGVVSEATVIIGETEVLQHGRFTC